MIAFPLTVHQVPAVLRSRVTAAGKGRAAKQDTEAAAQIAAARDQQEMGGSWPEQLTVTRLRTTLACVRFPANLAGFAWRGSGVVLWMGLVDVGRENTLPTRQRLVPVCEGRLFRLVMFLRVVLASRKRLRKRPALHRAPENGSTSPLEKCPH